MGEVLCKPAEAAAQLQVAERTLRRWRIEGTGPRWHRVGKQIRYSQADLDAWLASAAVEGQPAQPVAEPDPSENEPSEPVVAATA